MDWMLRREYMVPPKKIAASTRTQKMIVSKMVKFMSSAAYFFSLFMFGLLTR